MRHGTIQFKVEQYLKDKAGDITTETYLGRVIYTPDVPSGGCPRMPGGGVSFVDNLIVAGSVSAIKQAIDRMAATAPSVVDNSGMMGQIRTITAGSQVWAVGSFDPGDAAANRTRNSRVIWQSGTVSERRHLPDAH